MKDKPNNPHHDALLGCIMQVEWEDAWIDTEDHLISDARKLKPVLRSSVGYLVADNDNEIILCTDRYHSKKDEEYVNAAIKGLGLSEIDTFNPHKRIIEWAMSGDAN